MAICSTVLAWKIPWTEEPGGPQSMGPQESDTTERQSTRCSYPELSHLRKWQLQLESIFSLPSSNPSAEPAGSAFKTDPESVDIIIICTTSTVIYTPCFLVHCHQSPVLGFPFKRKFSHITLWLRNPQGLVSNSRTTESWGPGPCQCCELISCTPTLLQPCC